MDGRVVRVDTFAKLLGPGYRLGWVSGPPAIVQKLSLHFAAVSVGACSLSQVSLMLAETGYESLQSPSIGDAMPSRHNSTVLLQHHPEKAANGNTWQCLRQVHAPPGLAQN